MSFFTNNNLTPPPPRRIRTSYSSPLKILFLFLGIAFATILTRIQRLKEAEPPEEARPAGAKPGGGTPGGGGNPAAVTP